MHGVNLSLLSNVLLHGTKCYCLANYPCTYRYGVGYHMTIVKSSSCDPSKINSLVKSLVPKSEQVTNVGAELSYVLPSSSTPSFPELFDRLEANKAGLGILSFGVSVTTMEEVFMKVGGETSEDSQQDLYIILQHIAVHKL